MNPRISRFQPISTKAACHPKKQTRKPPMHWARTWLHRTSLPIKELKHERARWIFLEAPRCAGVGQLKGACRASADLHDPRHDDPAVAAFPARPAVHLQHRVGGDGA